MPEKLSLRITVVADALNWMAILGNIQLALRHPENSGPSVLLARQFASQLADKLVEEKVLSSEEMALMMREQMRAENSGSES